MVRDHSVKLFLILTVATFACRFTAPASVSPMPVSVKETAAAPAASIPSLTVEQLKNVQYQLGTSDDHRVVQLTDGKYQQGTDTTTLDFAYIALTQFTAIGDLTGDGVDEAAAVFLENYGGTGNFGLLTIYANVNGLPVFLTSTLIDDRPRVNSLSIENGVVFLDATIHGANDGGCCPQLPTTQQYALVNNQLRLTNFTTKAPSGDQRIIDITSPSNGTQASGSVHVSGTVSIAPFENNLTYFIYDEAGNQFAAGPLAVKAPDQGAPGTFDENFTLAGISPGTTIYLEIQDQSAADGFLLAMDSVKIFVK